MKKFSLLVLIIVSVLSVSNAQGWVISNKVAIGHSWTVGNRSNDNMKYAFHPMFQIGRSAVYNFSDNAGIGLGTFFTTEGATFKIDNDDENGKAEQRMNYIRIPLQAYFTFGDPESKVRPRIGIGASVGFLVGGKTYLISDDDVFAGMKTTKAMSTKIDAGATGSAVRRLRANRRALPHSIHAARAPLPDVRAYRVQPSAQPPPASAPAPRSTWCHAV